MIVASTMTFFTCLVYIEMPMLGIIWSGEFEKIKTVVLQLPDCFLKQ